MSANLKRTPLYEKHAAAHGKLVDFAGWEMPVNYGSQINEHHAVRRAAGMFDVSHMRAIDVTGADATKFLRHLFANDVNKLDIDGKALYTCMLNEQGGVIDDLIVYRNGDNDFRVVLNAGCADGDMEWIRQQLKASGMAVDIAERTDLAMLAIQGPQALELTSKAIPELAKIQYPAFFPAAQFGDYLVPEQVRKLGHEQQTPQGQQPAVMALTSIGPQEQRVVGPAGSAEGSEHLGPHALVPLDVLVDQLGLHLQLEADPHQAPQPIPD